MSESHILGKLLPNINVTVQDDHTEVKQEENYEASLESGEMLSHHGVVMNKFSRTEIIHKWMNSIEPPEKISPEKIENTGFETGIDMSPEVLNRKLDERAERFGIKQEGKIRITQLEINALYNSLRIPNPKLRPKYRLKVIHVRGVTNMNESHVQDYFKDFGIPQVEWVNDMSCNVVFPDSTTAARALISLSSQSLIVFGGHIDFSEPGRRLKIGVYEEKLGIVGKFDFVKEYDPKIYDSEMNELDRSVAYITLNIPVPPGCWRLGVQHPKAKLLLLRFATHEDKKRPGAEKYSDYYKIHGNPNHGGMKGLISSSRKRKFHAAGSHGIINELGGSSRHSNDISSDYNRRSKAPRMKLYADEEESYIQRRSSRKSGCSRSICSSVKSRLGSRYTQDDLQQIGHRYSSDDDVLENDSASFTCKIPSRFNIWTDQAKLMSQEEYGSLVPQRNRYPMEREIHRRNYYGSESYNSPLSSDTPSISSEIMSYGSSFPSTIMATSSASSIYPQSAFERCSVCLSFNCARSGSCQGERVERPQGDLRTRIQQLRKRSQRKYRSPLCTDDDEI